MDLASLWPAQSSLLLPLAMHLCSNGTLDMTSRDVNPGPPGRPLPLGKPNCPIVVCSYFWVTLFPFFAWANSQYLPRPLVEGLFFLQAFVAPWSPPIVSTWPLSSQKASEKRGKSGPAPWLLSPPSLPGMHLSTPCEWAQALLGLWEGQAAF